MTGSRHVLGRAACSDPDQAARADRVGGDPHPRRPGPAVEGRTIHSRKGEHVAHRGQLATASTPQWHEISTIDGHLLRSVPYIAPRQVIVSGSAVRVFFGSTPTIAA